MLCTLLGSVILALLIGPTAGTLVAGAAEQECQVVDAELARSGEPHADQERRSAEAAELGRQLQTSPDDAGTILASRVYRRNKSSLLACDRLAERRGESLAGQRVTFLVETTASGAPTVQIVDGEGLPSRLLACYRAVAHHWELPATGSPYATGFVHVH
jgi:hypothetical protein